MNKGERFRWAKILAQYVLLGMYQVTVGLYVRLRYRLTCTARTNVPQKGPFLLLGNHCNNFDGLFLQCLFGRPIRFVVTDGVFRNKMLARVLRLVDYIPKRKTVSDAGAIRQIIQVVKDRGIVGIFPEGGRNWDGLTGPITPTTFRLIKMLKIPVVAATIKGAYLSEPRWADTKRRGRIEVDLRMVIEGDTDYDVDEIARIVTAALAHNEFDWQRKRRIRYTGRALSQGLERLLFICPACRAVASLESSDEGAGCASCGMRCHIDDNGFLQADVGVLPTDRLDHLAVWQQEQLDLLFHARPQTSRLMADDGGRLYASASREHPYEAVDHGRVLLTRHQVIMGRHAFDLSDMTGINVFFKSHLEFRYNRCDYRIVFNDVRISAYKWCSAIVLARHMLRVLSNGSEAMDVGWHRS